MTPSSRLGVVVGVFCGLAIALPVGFILGWYKSVRAFIDPVINFFRALPPIALIPLVIVYFGIGELARLSVLIYAAFFSSVIVIYEGIKMIPPIYIRVSKALGATDFEIFKADRRSGGLTSCLDGISRIDRRVLDDAGCRRTCRC